MNYDTIIRTGGLLLYVATAVFAGALTALLLAGGHIPLAAAAWAVFIVALALAIRHEHLTAQQASSGHSGGLDDTDER